MNNSRNIIRKELSDITKEKRFNTLEEVENHNSNVISSIEAKEEIIGIPLPDAWRKCEKSEIEIRCFPYVLGFGEPSHPYREIVWEYRVLYGLEDITAGSSFMKILLDEEVIEKIGTFKNPPKNFKKDYLALYLDAKNFDDKNMAVFKHAGFVKGGRREIVESIWGDIRRIFKHPAWHVPEEYGQTIEYYSLPNLKRDLSKLFEEYCLDKYRVSNDRKLIN